MRSSVLRCRIAVPCSSCVAVLVGRYRVRVPVLCESGGIVSVFRCCVSRAVSCESYHGIISQCRVADRVAVSLRCQ